MSASSSKFSRLPATVWILGLVSLFTDISSEMIHSLLPLLLVNSLGVNTVVVGLIEGFAEALASVLKVFSGSISDRLGKRKILLIAGYGLSSFTKPLFALASNAWLVLLARAMDRTGKGIRGAPRDALLADVTPDEMRGAAFGLRQSLDSIGAVIGPLIAVWLMYLFAGDIRSVFWFAAMPAFISVLLVMVGVQDKKVETTNNSGKDLVVKHPDTGPYWTNLKRSVERFGPAYWFLVAAGTLYSLGNASDAFILLRANEMGLEQRHVPMAIAVMNATFALSAYPIGILSDRAGRLPTLIVGLIGYAVVYAGFGMATSLLQIWGLLTAYGVTLGMTQGALLALVSRNVPAEVRGTAFGMISLSMGVVLLPASAIAGYLWKVSSPTWAFLCGTIFAGLAALVLLAGYRQITDIETKVG